jgi:hypothetical protein
MALRHHSTITEVEEPPIEAVVIPDHEEIITPMGEHITVQQGVTHMDDRWVAIDAPTSSFGLFVGGAIALLLAVWAALVPFIGPTFGFSLDGTSSWTWNDVHAWGAVVPGAVAFFAALIVLANAGQPTEYRSPGALRTAGLLLFLSGAWLTVVPVVWPVIVGHYFVGTSASLTLQHWLAAASGPGLLLATFGGVVMGRAHCVGTDETD